MTTLYYGVSVARRDVKVVKTHLEKEKLRNKTLSITQDTSASDCERMIIPTSITASNEPGSAALHALGHPLVHIEGSAAPNPPVGNALTRAFESAAAQLPPPFWRMHDLNPAAIFAGWRPASIIYTPMLLLKSATLAHTPFAAFVAALDEPSTPAQDRTAFWAYVARAMGVTHIALDAPVPADTADSTNALRSPVNLRPLYGDFGPAANGTDSPGDADFAAALWVRVTQNGLAQTWAPRHSMFSAGNVGEKARVLTFAAAPPPPPPSQPSSGPHRASAAAAAAVDLFAGIGYFAFSYAAATANLSLVLAWDLNPWSTEALRRGALLNGFPCTTFPVTTLRPHIAASADAYADVARDILAQTPRARGAHILVANESNAHAGARVRALRRTAESAFPAVRHVNCGMLPSADFAWRVACEVLDPWDGGWLHLHETVREERVALRAEEIRGVVEGYVRRIGWGVEVAVRIERVVRVKSIAPRTVHVVVDLVVEGCGREEWDVRSAEGVGGCGDRGTS